MSGEGGLGLGDARVVVIVVDMGGGVVGWVVVVVSLTQVVGLWVGSWSSHRRCRWWGHGDGGSLTWVVGSWSQASCR